MLAGHFTTALIANQKTPKGTTLLYFLIVSQLQDLVWLLFHYLGIEPTQPNDILDGTLGSMNVDMLYSHDLLPLSFWVLFIFIIGKILFKSTKIGLMGSVLVLGHFVLDAISGYPHHVFGEETHNVGLGLYTSNVYLALAIEAVFCIFALWYFFNEEIKNGITRTFKNKASIIGVFVFGIVFLLIVATTSLRQRFNIPEFDIGFNTNIPTLILTYVGMIFCLNYIVSKKVKPNK